MFDTMLRRHLEGPLAGVARLVDRPWMTPDRLSVAGLVLGLSSAVLASLALWWPAVMTWLLSRVADGLDGPLARRRRSHSDDGSGAGGYLDIVADFAVYGASIVGISVGAGEPGWPFLLVMLAYYVNGTAFLAFSSIAERTGRQIDDGRSLSFLGGIAEGAETIAAHTLMMMLPDHAPLIATVWAAVVGAGATWRAVTGYRLLC